MVGEYTMNEYKVYKALVKHRKKINRIFSEVCGDKFFSSRGPGPKLKLPAVAVASCSAACNTRKFHHNKILLATWFSFIF
jgi:hypothetical protein